MNEYPIYTDEGKLFCRCRYQENGIILMGKNSEIAFTDLTAKLSKRDSALEVREKNTVSYGRANCKRH